MKITEIFDSRIRTAFAECAKLLFFAPIKCTDN